LTSFSIDNSLSEVCRSQ